MDYNAMRQEVERLKAEIAGRRLEQDYDSAIAEYRLRLSASLNARLAATAKLIQAFSIEVDRLAKQYEKSKGIAMERRVIFPLGQLEVRRHG